MHPTPILIGAYHEFSSSFYLKWLPIIFPSQVQGYNHVIALHYPRNWMSLWNRTTATKSNIFKSNNNIDQCKLISSIDADPITLPGLASNRPSPPPPRRAVTPTDDLTSHWKMQIWKTSKYSHTQIYTLSDEAARRWSLQSVAFCVGFAMI